MSSLLFIHLHISLKNILNVRRNALSEHQCKAGERSSQISIYATKFFARCCLANKNPIKYKSHDQRSFQNLMPALTINFPPIKVIDVKARYLYLTISLYHSHSTLIYTLNNHNINHNYITSKIRLIEKVFK